MPLKLFAEKEEKLEEFLAHFETKEEAGKHVRSLLKENTRYHGAEFVLQDEHGRLWLYTNGWDEIDGEEA